MGKNYKIKLIFGKKSKKHGKFFKVVVSLNKKARNSSFIETLGVYFNSSELKTHILFINLKRLVFWINNGAEGHSLVYWLAGRIYKNCYTMSDNFLLVNKKNNNKKSRKN